MTDWKLPTVRAEKKQYPSEDALGALFVGMFGFMLLLGLISPVLTVYHAPIASDTTSQLSRAEKSPTAEGMVIHLQNAAEGFERHGLTSGHYAIFTKTSENDIGEDIEDIDEALARAQSLSAMDHDSTAYQNGMIQLRSTVGDISPDLTAYMAIHDSRTQVIVLGTFASYFVFWVALYFLMTHNIKIEYGEEHNV